MRATDPSTIVHELSTGLQGILPPERLSATLVDLLADSEALHDAPWGASVMVFRVTEGIVAKYLSEHLPGLPCPRPCGLVRIGHYLVLFMTFVPGRNLEKAWPELDDAQKRSVSSQLDALLLRLRSLSFPEDRPLGGVRGEGCQDARRRLRVNSDPIMNIQQFEDFISTASKFATPTYIQFLRNPVPADSVKCVFTHGDFRPANIMVDKGEDGAWKVVSVLDWESSGFYPEYWESIKATNNLGPLVRFDWYLYLPRCVSPGRYAIHWLVDRVWDLNMMNST